jgi:ParB family transcriptional regulator, chromosome partitioning protein
MEGNNDSITTLPIDQIQPNPLQPRGVITPDSLSEMVESIKTHGVIQPLIIAHTPAGYQIIAGERRWRASRIVGLQEVPVRIIETSPQGMLEMAIVENVQRTDLNPVDRANSFERLIHEFGLTNTDICARIGKSPAFVSNTMRLLELPDALKDGLISGIISEGHARALAAIPDKAMMIEAYKTVLREGASVRRAEELARRFKKSMHRTKPSDGFNTATVNEIIDKMTEQIRGWIGDNAKVKMHRSRVETTLQISLRGNPEQTEAQIQQIYSAFSVQSKTQIEKEAPVSPPTPIATPVETPAPKMADSEPEIDLVATAPAPEVTSVTPEPATPTPVSDPFNPWSEEA